MTGDDRFWHDLENSNAPRSLLDSLREREVLTYDRAFSILRDTKQDEQLVDQVCMALWYMSGRTRRSETSVDRRRVVPALLPLIKSSNRHIRETVIRTLGSLESKAAVVPLIAIALDKNEEEEIRREAVDALSYIDDPRIMPVFRQVIYNREDPLNLRGRAVEESSMLKSAGDMLPDYIGLLSAPEADMRFWAAYGLTCSYGDISSALSELDRVVTFDHNVPQYWGWHVDREAIRAFERIHFDLLCPRRDEEGEVEVYFGTSYLISPAPEYSTFMYQLRPFQPDLTYPIAEQPPVTLQVSADWLAEKLRERWPDIKFNVRQPRPQAYLLDWLIENGDGSIIGGLHRDQYGVVLTTADDAAVYAFAAWYRSLIDPDQPLFLYDWGDEGVELRYGMTEQDVRQAVDALDERQRNTGLFCVTKGQE